MQILFITSSRVGDAILTTGILKYLVDHYKTAKFTIACGPVAKGLFDNVPGLEAIITMRKGSLFPHWAHFTQERRARAPFHNPGSELTST